MFRNIFTTDNSLDSSFHGGEILVLILVQSICLGNGCIYLCIISVLVLQGSNGIFDSFRHCIHFALFSDILVTGNSIDGGFHAGEVLVVVLVQCVCFGNSFDYFRVVRTLVFQNLNGILYRLRHSVYLRLFRFAFIPIHSLNCSRYIRIIRIQIRIQGFCLFDCFVNCRIVSGNISVIPSKCRMSNPGYPLYIASCICLKS